MNPSTPQSVQKEEWAIRFDEKFTYLPPKESGKDVFIVSDDFKMTPEAAKVLMTGGVLQIPKGSEIKKLDNTDVRKELKDFIRDTIDRISASVREETRREIAEEMLAEAKQLNNSDSIEHCYIQDRDARGAFFILKTWYMRLSALQKVSTLD